MARWTAYAQSGGVSGKCGYMTITHKAHYSKDREIISPMRLDGLMDVHR